jgi:anti-anti-sigma regulatory factor
MIAMPMKVSFVREGNLLDLSFEGNLDLTGTHAVCSIVPQIQNELKTCILDLTRVERVFDSGIALLRMLSRNLHQMGATVVVLGTHPDLRQHLFLIQGDAAYPSRGALAAAMTSPP